MIQVIQGFKLSTRDPVDSRFVLSKVEMKAINDNQMPSKYFAICTDDGLIYLYDKEAEASETTGKFRKADASIQEQLTELLGKVTDLGDLVDTINTRLDGDEFVKNEELGEKLPGAIVEAMKSPETKEQMEEAISGALPGAISEAMKSTETKEKMVAAISETLPEAISETLKDPETKEQMEEAISGALPGAIADAMSSSETKEQMEAAISTALPGAINDALKTPETKKQIETAISGTIAGAINEVMKDPEAQAAKDLTDAISTTMPEALKKSLESQEEAGGLEVDENGNIKVALNDQHLQIIDKKIDLAISVIEAIDGN